MLMQRHGVGCYTSQARQKWANRHNENLLYTAEAAAAIGEAVAGVAYPHHNLDEAWKHVLFDLKSQLPMGASEIRL